MWLDRNMPLAKVVQGRSFRALQALLRNVHGRMFHVPRARLRIVLGSFLVSRAPQTLRLGLFSQFRLPNGQIFQ